MAPVDIPARLDRALRLAKLQIALGVLLLALSLVLFIRLWF